MICYPKNDLPRKDHILGAMYTKCGISCTGDDTPQVKYDCTHDPKLLITPSCVISWHKAFLRLFWWSLIGVAWTKILTMIFGKSSQKRCFLSKRSSRVKLFSQGADLWHTLYCIYRLSGSPQASYFQWKSHLLFFNDKTQLCSLPNSCRAGGTEYRYTLDSCKASICFAARRATASFACVALTQFFTVKFFGVRIWTGSTPYRF